MTRRAAFWAAGHMCLATLWLASFVSHVVAAPTMLSIDPLTVEKGSPVANVTLEATFTSSEQNLITQYFQNHKADAQKLPPGIAKKLSRGKPLPPGIAKKLLPGDLETTLPARSGYERVIVGSDVMLINVASQLVTDILRNVIH